MTNTREERNDCLPISNVRRPSPPPQSNDNIIPRRLLLSEEQRMPCTVARTTSPFSLKTMAQMPGNFDHFKSMAILHCGEDEEDDHNYNSGESIPTTVSSSSSFSTSSSSSSSPLLRPPPTLPPVHLEDLLVTSSSNISSNNNTTTNNSTSSSSSSDSSGYHEDTQQQLHSDPETQRRKRKGITPTDRDVVFGRGGFANAHVGNQRMLGRVTGLKPRYKMATKKHKTDMSRFIVQSIMQEGGRFLIRSNKNNKRKYNHVDNDEDEEEDDDDEAPIWREASIENARRKVSQALRQETPLERLERSLDRISKVEQRNDLPSFMIEKEKKKLTKKLRALTACLDA